MLVACGNAKTSSVLPPLVIEDAHIAEFVERYPDVASLSATTFDELFPYIKSISYPNNKTRHLIGMAQMLMTKFGGEVPLTVDELVQLPGVVRSMLIDGTTTTDSSSRSSLMDSQTAGIVSCSSSKKR